MWCHVHHVVIRWRGWYDGVGHVKYMMLHDMMKETGGASVIHTSKLTRNPATAATHDIRYDTTYSTGLNSARSDPSTHDSGDQASRGG